MLEAVRSDAAHVDAHRFCSFLRQFRLLRQQFLIDPDLSDHNDERFPIDFR
jgi:hypothetical protein